LTVGLSACKFSKYIMIKKLILYVLLISLLSFFTQCENGNKTISCFPNSSIRYSADLNLPQFQKLAGINGYVYIEAGPLTGTKGLILVKIGPNEFKAYDRNPPHICPGSNTGLVVKDDIYLYCPEDGAKWILTTGQPLEVANRSPKTYNAQLVGNMVIISY
jgi:nitrite reductase/ring-hydroxylating ferredoxin subunit